MTKLSVEFIAKMCHETNRSYCEAIGDTSQKPWDQAAQWQRDSAVKGVQFKLDNVNAQPADQHNAWKKDKVQAGWVHGAEKNETLKTHPCIVPYYALSLEQRRKDYLFGAIVTALSIED